MIFMAQEQNAETAAAKTYPPLEMEASVRLPIEPQKNLLGFANVTFNGALTVTDFKVLRDKDGNLFAAMPTKLVGGKYNPTTWIKGDEAKAQLQETVLTAYYTAVEKLKARAAQLTGEKPAPIAEQVAKAGKDAAEHNAGRQTQTKGKDKNAEL
jgi:DNA-binding cell septation regulator SpoVG